MQERLATLELLPTASCHFNAEKDQKKEKSQGRKFDNPPSKSSKVHNVINNSNLNAQKPQTNNNIRKADKSCSFCSKSHFIAYCYIFKGKPAKEKLEFCRSDKLCFNCLGQHHVKDCRTQKTCIICNSKHHTLLHDSFQATRNETSSDSPVEPTNLQTNPGERISGLTASVQVCCNNSTSVEQDCVLLGTALVRIESEKGWHLIVRALEDPGAEVSLASESLVKRLQLPVEDCSASISGIGDSNSKVSGITKFLLRSLVKSNSCYQVQAFILDQITSYVHKCTNTNLDWKHLKCLPLTDPKFDSNEPIDLLLGVDVFQLIVQGGVKTPYWAGYHLTLPLQLMLNLLLNIPLRLITSVLIMMSN